MDQRLSLNIKTFHFARLQILYFSPKMGKKSHDLDFESFQAVGGVFQGKKETCKVKNTTDFSKPTDEYPWLNRKILEKANKSTWNYFKQELIIWNFNVHIVIDGALYRRIKSWKYNLFL